MKKLLALGAAVALVGLAFAPSAFAGIVNSRHDMTNASNPYTTLQQFATYGACAACHVPHGAVGARLFPKVPVGAAGGFFGPLCQTCHDTSIVAGQINLNTDDTVLNTSGAHGLSITALSGTHQTVGTSNLPYTGSTGFPTISPNNIECLSCHDVHNQNSFRPFLQVDLDDLCEDCHNNRINDATATTGWANSAGGSGSTHPAGPTFTGDVSGIVPAVADSPINSTSIATELVQNVGHTGAGSVWGIATWGSGVQLSNQQAFGTGGVDCISCHNVHWDENDTPQNNGTGYLASVDDNTVASANTFCEFCHRGPSPVGYAGSNFPNPGNTSYTHPNDDFSGGNATILTIATAWIPTTQMPIDGTGASGLVCTSCHGIHPTQAASKTQMNTPILWNYGSSTSVCTACHGSGTGSYTGWNHHPVGAGTYATAGNNAGAITCAGGDTTAGLNRCHGSGGGTANGGWMAHNRTSPFGNPGTSTGTGNSDTCVACHTVNPSVYTTSTPYTAGGTASHYIGDVATTGITRTTDPGSGIRQAGGQATWSGSGLPSLWGANSTTIVCESCHRLAAGNRRSGDGATQMLVEVSGSSINIGDASVTGNAAYTATNYICTGCHLTPGGTHPLADATPSVYTISAAAQGETYTSNGLNCESCHSTHDAATTSGSYILDGTTAGTYGTGTGMAVEPTINYTSFCAVCHGTFQ